MGFGTVQVGRLRLREAHTPAAETFDSAVRKLTVTGQEASPGLSPADVGTVQDDILGLPGLFLPVTFTDKRDRDGYYLVSDTTASLMSWNGEVVTCDWTINLVRAGADSEIDLESRMAGGLTHDNEHSVTGERWHAPPIGHTAYWSADTTPSTMTRQSEDGDITIYRGVPVGVNPRFACPVAAYPAGRVRFLDALERERSGVRMAVEQVGWTLTNALTRVRWDATGLKVSAWDGSGWEQKPFQVTVAGEPLRTPDHATVIRNDYECVIVRLLWSRAVAGRTGCDVTLRRGSRLPEFFLYASPAATLSVGLELPEATTSAAGYIVASSNDVAGNKYMIGSAGDFTPDTINAAISVTSAASLDFVAGLVVGGSSAPTGDGAAVLYQQFIGFPPELVRGARR